jgi:hypothetical protein
MLGAIRIQELIKVPISNSKQEIFMILGNSRYVPPQEEEKQMKDGSITQYAIMPSTHIMGTILAMERWP